MQIQTTNINYRYKLKIQTTNFRYESRIFLSRQNSAKNQHQSALGLFASFTSPPFWNENQAGLGRPEVTVYIISWPVKPVNPTTMAVWTINLTDLPCLTSETIEKWAIQGNKIPKLLCRGIYSRSWRYVTHHSWAVLLMLANIRLPAR